MRPSPALVRRIDRLAKRAHAFHRFAHHPLCDNYAGELIALRGRTRVCRGCTTALLSAASGALVAVMTQLPPLPLGSASTLIGLAMLGAQATAPVRGPRPSKLLTRGVPAFLWSASLLTLLRQPTAEHLVSACAVFGLGWLVLARYRRRGPDRSPCQTCPERLCSAPCSGFRSIVRAERAFVRRSERLLDAAIGGGGGFAP